MAERTLKVLLDGTPLLGERTGIGRYTASLAEELASRSDVDTRAVAFTLRGWRRLRHVLPHGARARGMPVAARLLRRSWLHSPFPPVELFAGLADVVHGTNFVLPRAARAAGVLTIHDLAFLDAPEELARSDRELPQLVRQGAKQARVICTPTAAVAETVAERLDVPREKIQVTPLGVDAAWFTGRPPNKETRDRLRLPSEYLLYVGASNPRKGLDWLRKAHAADPELPPLVFSGPGPVSASGRVLHAGYLSEVDLRNVVAGASALVLPSRDEGFGLPVLEALACDVPVVCTDIPALREIAGSFARLVPYGDVEALAVAMGEAVAEPRVASLSVGRRAHAAGFTWRHCADATVEAYRRAAAK
ncbi:glycosyltransferase involved in cell wall biosynthesis [Amycolatopsis bartoniae]|uniref:Glycosyl transferase n=1 Tax=Amycolatopsis bartoniae TaxID=941986 RepID=A0A8H9J072_9PSEU|nr:glycosyltransferase family 1 protein [Amycolatopsis bartoniae]MBB2937301.1 glycosyltransferase involved in cell wall biosynthesis [Amycolatopsis bartoniae]TVT07941.1 glycosyltransferase family 4 protein [Amycolatopsis bartoniae]GHF77988.1 glycosyl transferase [Amycolatopsis bartoniae]